MAGRFGCSPYSGGWGGDPCNLQRQICGPVGCGYPPQGPYVPANRVPNGNGGGYAGQNVPYAMPLQNGGMDWGRAFFMAQQALGSVGDPTQGRDTMFGLDSGAGTILTTATATLTTSPQKRCIPKRIVIADTLTSTFLVSAILVGVSPILATNSNISAAVFDSDSTAQSFKGDILEVGMDFSMTVTNISAGTLRFVATVIATDLACFPCP